jgi:hypothetical protein
MTAHVTFYPLGNADSARIDLANGQQVLVDFGNQGSPKDPADLRCDLAKELRADLRKVGRDFYDVVCFTHLDDDHCKGTGDFFWLDYAAKYQGEGRTKIHELWVPAAALTEDGLADDARLVRQEARHRLRQGKGVLIFSRAEKLRDWMRVQGIDYESRKHLFVDAGGLVPGFGKEGAAKAEFFVHSPFAWRQDARTLIDRNSDSIVFQATFNEDGQETYALFASDVDHAALTDIVRTTKRKRNEHRLLWDLMKLPHHCSYTALGPERGTTETTAVDEVKWLFETQGRAGCTIVSPSKPIPVVCSKEDDDKQPPHRQAANHHRRVTREKGGIFRVTMEEPRVAAPKPLRLEISRWGVAALVSAPSVITTATSSPARQG